MARLDWCSCHSPTLLQALWVAITSCSKDLAVLVTRNLTSTEAPLAIAFVFLLTGIPTGRDILQFSSNSWRHWQLDLLNSWFGCVTGLNLLTLTCHLAHCWTICVGVVSFGKQQIGPLLLQTPMEFFANSNFWLAKVINLHKYIFKFWVLHLLIELHLRRPDP